MSISVYFKEIFTTNTRNYLVDPNWSTSELNDMLKNRIPVDFNIDSYEIVETCQHIEGIPAEYAPALAISDNILLRNLFGNFEYTAFYIRRVIDNENLKRDLKLIIILDVHIIYVIIVILDV